jgi:hypothetical protein
MVYSRVRKPARAKARNTWYLSAFLNGQSMRKNLFNLGFSGNPMLIIRRLPPKQV